MAEEFMVVQSLTEEMISAGAELTRRLDQKATVEAALWFLLPDTNTWRLVICIPNIDDVGPKKIYALIQSILGKQYPTRINISLTDISLASRNHPLIQLLRVAIGTGPDISGIRFSRNTISGQFIEDAYIYRMHVSSQQRSTADGTSPHR